MLGLGLRVTAVPYVGAFQSDLVHQTQPLSHLRNGAIDRFGTWNSMRDSLAARSPEPLMTAAKAKIEAKGI